MKQHYLHIDALYYLSDVTQEHFSFYVPVGVGYAKYEPSGSTGEGVEDTIFNAGVGAQYMFSDMWGIRGDIRGLYGISQKAFDAEAQVGLMIRFGYPVPIGGGEDMVKSADIRFKLNSTDIVNANDPDIRAAADALRNNPDANIKILAYSDKSGTSDYNMKLSQRRADKLKQTFVSDFGVDESRIYTKAFGDQHGESLSRHAIAIVEY